MKKQCNVERFHFRFSKLIIILSILAICLCLGGGAISVYRIVKFGIHNLQQALQGPFLVLVCLFGIVVLLSLLIKSEYALSKEYFSSSFGIIKSKVEISKISSILCDYKQNKITLYMGEEFVVLLLVDGDLERFSKTLLELSPTVEIRYQLEGDEQN